MENTLNIYCDGGARGNPGPAASAFVAVKNNKVVYKKSKYLGKATNNVAEYESLLLALAWLALNYKNREDMELIINLDSELVTKQMAGQYKVKNEKLKEMFIKGKKLEAELASKVVYRWAPRRNNRLADFLVNQELDNHL